MNKLKVVKSFYDLPEAVKAEVEDQLKIDILERYNNSTYHNEDIIHNTLELLGYKLADEQK